jgi:2-oxoglutarate ferredoxin oxidoreductase subunit alpha
VAPGDVPQTAEDCFEAFNWADRYQVPVIVLADKHLSTSFWTLDRLSFEGWKIDRGPLAGLGKANGRAGNGRTEVDGYRRYAPTPSGVSPRSLPGQEGGIFWTTSDEHDPRGHITESAANRIEMMRKRMGKLDQAAREIPPERKIIRYGPAGADFTLVGWGSTRGAILDALAELEASGGPRCNYLQVRLLRPFPAEEVKSALREAKRSVLVENNYTAQLGGLIREQTGLELPHRVLKYDGRPFSQEEMLEGLRAVFEKGEAKVAVSHLSA